jgi:hypothetical protein
MTRLGDRSTEDGAGKLLSLDRLATRIRRICGTTNDRKLARTFTLYGDRKVSLEAINSSLMDNFRQYGNLESYSLIYELNYRQFLLLIFKRLRNYHHVLDARDVLQDVFVSIYRYRTSSGTKKTTRSVTGRIRSSGTRSSSTSSCASPHRFLRTRSTRFSRIAVRRGRWRPWSSENRSSVAVACT